MPRGSKNKVLRLQDKESFTLGFWKKRKDLDEKVLGRLTQLSPLGPPFLLSISNMCEK